MNHLKLWSLFLSLPPHSLSCSIITRHKALEGLGQGSVEYQALQLVSSLEHYGVEWHWARDANGQRLAIGVGPEGIAVCKEDFSLINRYNLLIALYVLKMIVCCSRGRRRMHIFMICAYLSFTICNISFCLFQNKLSHHSDCHPVRENCVPNGYQGYK